MLLPLDLMGAVGRADKETFFKFLHNFLILNLYCLKQIKKLLYLIIKHKQAQAVR